MDADLSMPDRLAAVAGHLPGSLIALDFDGTLAPIVKDPTTSRPVAGTRATLAALGAAGAHLALITGRDARTVLELSGLADLAGLRVLGLYGAESWFQGSLDSPAVPEVIERLRARLPEVVAGATEDRAVWIEDKGLSLVVHARKAADPAAELRRLDQPLAALAAALGLQTHAGRGVIEVRLPGFDKGVALRQLVEQIQPSALLFAGDDIGDLPGFEVVRDFAATGRPAVGIAVRSPEASLADAADVVVESPEELVDLLARLLDDSMTR